MNKLNDNVYVIDFGISSILNVKDLVDYKSLDFILLIDKPSTKPIFESPSLPPLQDILLNTSDKVDKIFDDEIIAINEGRTAGFKDIWSVERKSAD